MKDCQHKDDKGKAAIPSSSCETDSDVEAAAKFRASALLPQHVQNFLVGCLHFSIESVRACPSAQQQVWIVGLGDIIAAEGGACDLWKDCLLQGRNRVVVRSWQGGCQWWNLNRNESPHWLAREELLGYRQCHSAFTGTNVVIPRVLYQELQERDDDRLPWAILEYVGPDDSNYFQDFQSDTSWMDSMVKARQEFGFDEPHPRWGRVPEDQALDYARVILRDFIFHLHNRTRRRRDERIEREENNSSCQKISDSSCRTYSSMVNLYEGTCQDILKAVVAYQYQSSSSLTDSDDVVQQTAWWDQILELVQRAVSEVLPSHALKIPTLSWNVLVHLDLQPQNLMFGRKESSSSTVRVVLDWEDAARADPRFELLLLGRKVCANRQQAECIWKEYETESKTKLGPLLPWLLLESIHNILTLLLQSMDLLNGGRNPWEKSKDLRLKLEREMVRWTKLMEGTKRETKGAADSDQTRDEEGEGGDECTDSYFAELGIDPINCYRS